MNNIYQLLLLSAQRILQVACGGILLAILLNQGSFNAAGGRVVDGASPGVIDSLFAIIFCFVLVGILLMVIAQLIKPQQ